MFSTPGLLRVFAASIIGRLPVGALGLIFILRTRELTGSYAAGGLVAGANAVAYGIGGPLFGRVVDRRGQTGVIVLGGVLSAGGMIGFGLLEPGASVAAAAALAAVAGAAFPPLSACLRTLWGTHLADEQRRHTAFAIEAAAFELVYIVGPLVFVGLIGAWSLRAAAAAAGVFALVGALLFAFSPVSRGWQPDRDRPHARVGALRGAGVRVILASLLVLGVAAAVVEIAVAAFAGSERLAALLLALWGAGSLVGGVLAARGRAPADPARRLWVLLTGVAVLTAPLALAGSPAALGTLLVVAGLAVAPALGTAYGLLGQAAPAGSVTEAFTFVSTAFGGGIGLGSALGGWIVEEAGTQTAFIVAAGAMTLAAAIAIAGRETLRTAGGAEPPAR